MEVIKNKVDINPDVAHAASEDEKSEARKMLQLSHINIFRDSLVQLHVQESTRILGEADPAEPLDMVQARIKDEDDRLLSEGIQRYLNAHGYDDANPLVPTFKDILTKYSSFNVDPGDWHLGPIDQTTGRHDTSKSGKALYEEEIKDLFGEEPDTLTPLHDAAEVTRLESNLETSRVALAQLSVQRRRLLTRGKGKKAKALAEQYRATETEYNNAKLELGRFSAESLQAAGMTDDEIKAQVLAGVLAEHAAFTAAEVHYMENDNSKLSRFIRWYANKKRNMIAANVVTGVASGFAINKLAKVGLLAILPGAGLGALVGARAGKALLTAKWGNGAQLHNEFEKRRTADTQTLTNQVTEAVQAVAGGSADEYAQLFTNNTSRIIGERINADVRGNQKRTAISAAIAGSAAIVGAVAADHIHWPGSGGGSAHENPGAGGGAKSPDEILKDAGVTDPALRQHIIDNPEAFERMVENPEQFQRFLEGAQHAPNIELHVGDVFPAHEVVSVPHGGGIIQDVIRPAAAADGHSLTSAQETQIWQALRARFGNELFTNLPVGSHGNDQWILQSGQGQLRPEVSQYLSEQIARTR